MALQVPIVQSIDQIYTHNALPAETARWSRVMGQFESIYNKKPSFVARAPGRVNIIGEHIDYSLYAVLPMAITADVLLVVSIKKSTHSQQAPGPVKIQLANTNSEKYPAREFNLDPESVDIDASQHEWTNYFLSGFRCAIQILKEKGRLDVAPVEMQILMDGSVPAGSGLSSSAAFTTASALSVLYANGETSIDKRQLTELAIVSERAAGVNSGGMDQAASVFSIQDSALYVEFFPSLKAAPIKFPDTDPELLFLVAQSFVVSDKSVSGPVCYNLRVVECTLAAAMLHKKLGLAGQPASDSAPLGISLRGFHAAYFHASKDSMESQLEQLIAITRKTLDNDAGYTRKDISSTLDVTEQDLEERFMTEFPVRTERFKLGQRAIHVFTEALRVLRFHRQLAEAHDQNVPNPEDFTQRLGDIMNQAQASARDVYECSCDELDRICAIARRAGACGSRLTGAGWGGCTVHLVTKDRVEDVKTALMREYYDKLTLTEEQRAQAMVVSPPGNGSVVLVYDHNALSDK